MRNTQDKHKQDSLNNVQPYGMTFNRRTMSEQIHSKLGKNQSHAFKQITFEDDHYQILQTSINSPKQSEQDTINLEKKSRNPMFDSVSSSSSFMNVKNNLNQLNKKQNLDLKISIAFNQIRDLTNKEQIHEAIKMLDNKDERCMLIDKILKRKEEKMDADQFLKITKVQPLVNRFMRKMKKNNDEEPYKKNNSKININNEEQQKSQNLLHLPDKSLQQQEQQISIKIIKNDDPNQMDENKNIKEDPPPAPSIRLIPDNNQTPHVDTTQDNNKISSVNILENKNKSTHQIEKKGEPSLENKMLIFAMFSGGDKKKKGDLSSSNKISISANKEQYSKMATNGKKINLNKVSENSQNLINKGREQTKMKVNELLKDIQKQSLAAHFKSFSFKNKFNLNQQNLDNQEINTFHTEDAEAQLQKQKEKMLNYINYQNQLSAAKVVTNEVTKYIDKYKKDPENFIVYPKIIQQPHVRSIENQIQKNCIEHAQQAKKKQVPSLKEYCTNRWRTGNLLNRSGSGSNLFLSPQRLLSQNSNLDDLAPYFTSRTKKSENQLFDDYASRKSVTMQQRGRGKNPFNITKGFQSPIQFNHKNSTSHLINDTLVQDHVITGSTKLASSLNSSRQFLRSPEQNYTSQRNRISYQNKKHFSYENELFFLFDIPKDKKEEDVLKSDEGKEEKITDDYMRTFDTNKQMSLQIKNVKTVNKWRLDGSIHFTGDDHQEILNKSYKNDDSLVSFTEIKLDKLYTKTRNIQCQQRFLERLQINMHNMKRMQKDIYQTSSELHRQNLIKVKNDVLYTTQYKLRKSGQPSLHS